MASLRRQRLLVRPGRGRDNGRVSAVLMEQGQMIWQQRISQATGSTEIDRLSDVDTTPVVVNGVVFALAIRVT